MTEAAQLGMDVTLLSAVGGAQAAYLSIPAQTIRHFCDTSFPLLAKDTLADTASGAFHRWKEGHDLLVDVLPELFQNPAEKFHQAGHILLTDFPTKAGIPIPGFSASGLGQLMVDIGIPKGYMCLNIMDSAVGILAIADGAHNLLAAISGDLAMNCWVAFDTFGTGTMEILAGAWLQNPLLILGGAENMMAGVVSTIKTFSYSVDPAVFFGASLGSFIIGCGVTLLLNSKEPLETRVKSALNAGSRSALIGALGCVSSCFGLAAAAGLGLYSIGALMGQASNASPITEELYQSILHQHLQNPDFRKIWQKWQQHVQAIRLSAPVSTLRPPKLRINKPLTPAAPKLMLKPPTLRI